MGTAEEHGKYFHFDNNFWKEPLKCGFLDLYQIGELCCECGFKIDEHDQSVYEITYVISGSGYSYVDGERCHMSEGDVFVNSIGHKHFITADDSNLFRYTYIGFRFNDNATGQEFDQLKAYYSSKPYRIAKDQNDILYCFLRCMDELYSKTVYSLSMVRNYCEQIVVLATRDSFEKREIIIERAPYQNAVSTAVYAVIRYVEKNIYTINRIEEIAGKLGYNYSYLSHFFKEKTGITLQKYINYKKVERAIELMKYGNLSVTRIAAKFNYESLQSFSKAFRRVMGVAPTKYMKMEREKDQTEREKVQIPPDPIGAANFGKNQGKW